MEQRILEEMEKLNKNLRSIDWTLTLIFFTLAFISGVLLSK